MEQAFPPMQNSPSIPWHTATVLSFLVGLTSVNRTKPVLLAASAYAICVFLYFLLYPPAHGAWNPRYQFGCQVAGTVIRLLNQVVFRRAEDFERIGTPGGKKDVVSTKLAREGNGGASESANERSLWQKTKDGFDVAIALRGVGRRLQVKNIPPALPASYPRYKFIAQMLYGATWRFFIADLITTWIADSLRHPSPRALWTDPLPLALTKAFLFFLSARFGMDLLYRLAAAVAVGLHLTPPSAWPPLMGRKREGYTIRRFWSFTWHQIMRLLAAPPVEYVTHRLLRIRKGTYLSNYVKVFGAFFVAFVLHAYGSWLAGANWVADWNFFMGQAVAIWVEEHVVRLAKACGVKSDAETVWWGWMGVGYAWTILAESWLLLWWNGWYIQAGSMDQPLLGFSIAARWFET